MKVKVKSWNAVAYWLWDVKDPDDICGICQSNFDGCCASCKEPGDSCPLLFGKCSHEFHLHCIMKWLQDNDGCPSCRRPWAADFPDWNSFTAFAPTLQRKWKAPQSALPPTLQPQRPLSDDCYVDEFAAVILDQSHDTAIALVVAQL